VFICVVNYNLVLCATIKRTVKKRTSEASEALYQFEGRKISSFIRIERYVLVRVLSVSGHCKVLPSMIDSYFQV
jgi:hypothetical protein